MTGRRNALRLNATGPRRLHFICPKTELVVAEAFGQCATCVQRLSCSRGISDDLERARREQQYLRRVMRLVGRTDGPLDLTAKRRHLVATLKLRGGSNRSAQVNESQAREMDALEHMRKAAHRRFRKTGV